MLAYGQTGSGKTFTISGILDRIAFDLFKQRDPDAIRIHVSMFEMLGNQVFLMVSLEKAENQGLLDVLGKFCNKCSYFLGVLKMLAMVLVRFYITHP